MYMEYTYNNTNIICAIYSENCVWAFYIRELYLFITMVIIRMNCTVESWYVEEEILENLVTILYKFLQIFHREKICRIKLKKKWFE